MKLTFKNDYPTGPYASFGHTTAEIKWGGKVVGSIQYMADREGWGVLLHISDEVKKPFRNITLKKRFEGSEREQLKAAKEWLKENWNAITDKFPLVQLD